MIPQDFIDQLLTRVDIVDVVERYVSLKKAGQNYMACCPFHKEKSPSFSVSPSKQFYHCFGCGAHGNAIRFVMEHAGLGFIDAVNELAASVGMSVPQAPASPQQQQAARQRPSLLECMGQAARFYKQSLKRSPEAIAYLKKRGLTGEIAARFALGYAPDGWTPLQQAFDDYLDDNLVECGLVLRHDDGRRYDRFRHRIMFPIRSSRGDIIGFGGRVLDQGEPKYLNSPETPLFEKGRELYGLYEARQGIRDAGRVLVVEGYMDVVALAQYGIDYAVAALGTATTPTHVQKLLRQADHVFYCFDGDAAGQRAAWRALENSLEALVDGKALHFLFLPSEHDPDSYVREFGRDAFEQALTRDSLPLSAYLVNELTRRVDMQSQEGRAELVKLATPLLAKVGAPTLGVMLRRRVAELAQIDLNELDRLTGRTPRFGKKTHPRGGARGPRHDPSLVRRLIRWLALNPALAAQVQLDIDPAECGPELQALLALALLIQSEATPPSPAQLEERLRDTELGERLRPLLVQAWQDGDLADALPQEVSDASRRLADNIRHAQLERLTEKERHQGLTDEEKRRLLELLRMSAGPSRS